MFGLTLIAVLVVMGGIIAYIGDWLGSRVGKRKLTVFGLRPKHTSILFTIVTGIVIAGVTLGTLSVSSRDVRTALFGMEALKAELTGLSREVAAKSVELDASRSALEAKTKEYSALTVKINETTANLAAVNEQLAAVNAERDRTAAALAAAKGDLGKAQQEIDALQTTKSELDARVASLNTAKTQLQDDVDRLNELTANLSHGIQIVREGVVVFRAGEALATAVTKGGRPKSEAEQIMASIINGTNQRILTKLGAAGKNIELLFITRADFDQAVEVIASTQDDIIVRIVAAGNFILGEPVIGRIELYPNKLVYKAEETVLAQTMDVGNDAKQAEDAVLLFLQRVNAQAIVKGILPDPLQGTVGVMSGSQLFDTVNKVKRLGGGRVELTAVAKGDIYTAGPLQIELRVRSVQN
jgi:uncharacterized protein (DUF3084 family)